MNWRLDERVRGHLIAASYRLWYWYAQLQTLVIVALCVIFTILVLLYVLSSRVALQPSVANALDSFLVRHGQILPLVQLARDVILSCATVLAGTWSYYVFIKGRTFRPRLSIDIHMRHLCATRRDVAVVRVSIKNEGRTRIRPALAQAVFSHGILREDRIIEFRPFHCVENMLDDYYKRTERFALEPQDVMHIDVPVALPPRINSRLLGQDTAIGLHVKVKVWDIWERCWRENAILEPFMSEA